MLVLRPKFHWNEQSVTVMWGSTKAGQKKRNTSKGKAWGGLFACSFLEAMKQRNKYAGLKGSLVLWEVEVSVVWHWGGQDKHQLGDSGVELKKASV